LIFCPKYPVCHVSEKVALKETIKLGEVEIPVISYDHLILNKQALNRPKDQDDIRQLELKRQAEKPRQPRPRQRPG
jgi:hypothetical protein